MPCQITHAIGPILFLDDVVGDRLLLSALFGTTKGVEPPPIDYGAGTAGVVALAHHHPHATVWRAVFAAR